jgi:hypothetical protein
MGVFAPPVDFQLGEQAPAEPVFRQHSTHSRFDQALGLFLTHLTGTGGPNPARVSRMTVIRFGLGLCASELHFGCIYNDHEIARILVGSEIGTVFAAQDHCGA